MGKKKRERDIIVSNRGIEVKDNKTQFDYAIDFKQE